MHVRILKPSKTAMQSGIRKTKKWIIEFPPLDRADANELMGWAQSRDTIKQMRLEFDSLEHAQSYAEQKGLTFEVIEPKGRSVKNKSYADNFSFKKIS